MGLTTFFGDDSGYDSGVANSTQPVTIAPPDASGGAGSFLSALLPTLTNGINATLAAKLNADLGFGVGTGLATVDANGNLTYKATPAYQVTPTQAATASAISSLPLIIGGVALFGLVLLLTLKK